MKKKKILEKNIDDLELVPKITDKLKNSNINTVEDLWNLKRQDLKDLKFSDSDINQITIKLQLGGVDLNKKIC